MIKPEPGQRPTATPSMAETRAAASLSTAAQQRRAQVLGLLLIAAAILALTLLRADLHTLFAPGWWRF